MPGRALRDRQIKPTRDVGCLNTVSNACARHINPVHGLYGRELNILGKRRHESLLQYQDLAGNGVV